MRFTKETARAMAIKGGQKTRKHPHKGKHVVYTLTFSDRSVYVGSTSNAPGRYKKHRKRMKAGEHMSSNVQTAYDRCGYPEVEWLHTDCSNRTHRIFMEDCVYTDLIARGVDVLNVNPPQQELYIVRPPILRGYRGRFSGS